MEASEDWDTFYRMLNRVLPPFSKLPLLALAEEASLPEAALKELPA
jgi:hypothetical protein